MKFKIMCLQRLHALWPSTPVHANCEPIGKCLRMAMFLCARCTEAAMWTGCNYTHYGTKML